MEVGYLDYRQATGKVSAMVKHRLKYSSYHTFLSSSMARQSTSLQYLQNYNSCAP